MLTNILEYLEDTAVRLPDKPAFTGPSDSALTFGELQKLAKGIGSFLLRRGLNGPAAVFMEKSPETVAAFFGVLYSGCFYVPLDEEMPGNRLKLIINNLNPGAVICSKKTYKAALELAPPENVILFDEAAAFIHNTAALINARRNHIDCDPAYVVFTSGSTGTPKGVIASHRAVIDYIEHLSDILSINEETVFGSQTPLYVDACLKEIICTIKQGASTYFIPKSFFMFPVKLVEYLNDKQINTICWVVSALTMISGLGALGKVKPRFLRTIAFGSEVFPLSQFRLWRESLPETRFINLYGPTEATGMSCYYEVNREIMDGEPIPIGNAFPNTRVLLMDGDVLVTEPDRQGEICITGAGLSLGYYNDQEKTEKAFTPNPLRKAYRETIYHTGDIGKYNSFGELVYVARMDYQIKHMGHRIELTEIEAAASAISGVAQAACVYNDETSSIHLYYVGSVEPSSINSALKDSLPRYMLPQNVEKLERMPMTPNMKIDRKSLKGRGQ